MKLMLLSNTKLIFLSFLYNLFYQSNAYHLKNKHGNEFRTLMSLLNDEKFVDINREKVNTFLKSIDFQRYDDDDYGYACKITDCPGDNQKCIPKGHDFYCECNANFQLEDGSTKGTKDIKCKDTYECKGTECTGDNQKCVPKGKDYYCDCNENFKLVDEDKKGTKDIQCEAITYYCKIDDCPGKNTHCVPTEKTFKCECLIDFEPVDEKKKDTNELACKDKYKCESTDCFGENQKCVPNGSDYYCDCNEGFELKDNSKKGTKYIKCTIAKHVCKDTDCKGENTKCVEAGSDYTCECKDGFVPIYDTKKGRKDVICIVAKHVCKDTDCEGQNTNCVEAGSDYTCECKYGFVPKDDAKKGRKDNICIVAKHVCKDTDCKGENTKCVEAGSDYTCECKDGFVPKEASTKGHRDAVCVAADYVCKGHECKSPSSKCVTKDTDFFCECKPGYKLKVGKSRETNKDECKQINKCDLGMFSCPLPERAKCMMIGDDDYYCECKDGYVPKEGEVRRNKEACTSGCDKHFCKEGSTCYPLGKDYWCICPPFFEGKNCTNESAYRCKDGDCPGANTKCVPDGNTYKCECLDGFELVDESKKNAKEAVCKRKGKCDCGVRSTGCKRDEAGKAICDCFEGYAQYRDICLDCYCGQHSLSCSFDDVGNKKCLCIAGYAQRNITCAAMCRSNSDCLNGGICRYDGNGYFCSCKEHYKGDKCETNDVCDSMIEKCDAIGAVCTYNELLRKGFCECPPTRTFNRKRKICEDICKPGICVHGKCEVVDYHEKCRCYDGYEGDDCDQKISKITDKLEWSIVLALLIASLTCFITIILCFLRSRK